VRPRRWSNYSHRYATTSNSVDVWQTVWAQVGVPKNMGTLGPRPLGWGRGDHPLETYFSQSVLPCQLRSFWVKPYERNYGNPPKMILRVPLFKVTQGYWQRHGSIGNLWLPISDPKFQQNNTDINEIQQQIKLHFHTFHTRRYDTRYWYTISVGPSVCHP